jgi:hypothetical protein
MLSSGSSQIRNHKVKKIYIENKKISIGQTDPPKALSCKEAKSLNCTGKQ